jgi:glycosyltransferase involved in cell wall biosynthesis
MKIAFLTRLNTGRKQSSWLIADNYMLQALQKQCGEVVNIDSASLRGEILAGKFLNKASQTLLKKRFLYYDTEYIAKKFATIAAQKLSHLSVDVIIACNCATEIAFLETSIPIVLVEGATFTLLHNYYPEYSKLLDRSALQGNTLHKLALKRAKRILLPSEWAARSAIEDYHVNPQKVHILPFGANIDKPPSLEEIVMIRQKSDHCRLLFVGTDWRRKGGDIAFETLVKLEEMGLQAELIVCGCVPPRSLSHERMKVIPFLDKRDERQHQELQNLFMTAHFFLLPTRQENFGFSFSEASAFGLPALGTNTGGVSGAIKEGENGFLLPPNADSTAYAEVIARTYRDNQGYTALVKSSRAAFDERLNWETWAIAVNKLIREM